jgi:Na+/H+-dicarboxylate symporter
MNHWISSPFWPGLLKVLRSGPAVTLAAAAGLIIGWNSPASSLADDFFNVYRPFYRMLAYPFLCLTVIYAFGRMSRAGADRNAAHSVVIMMPLLMVSIALVASTVTSVLSQSQIALARDGMGALIASLDQSESNVAEVSLSGLPADHTLLGRFAAMLGDFIPQNVFADFSTSNIGPVVLFLIIFSVALLRLPQSTRRPFLDLIEAMNRPFERLLTGILVIVPAAAFFYALRASHLLASRDFSGVQLLFEVVVASAIVLIVMLLGLIAVLTRQSPFTVARSVAPSVLTGLLSMTDEAALPNIIRTFEDKDHSHRNGKEIVASLAISIGRFGRIALVASVLTFIATLYEIPLPELVFAILTGALVTGINGPGVFVAAIGFAGSVVGLPVDGILVLVILIEPLLELFLIPVAVTAAFGLVALVRPAD